MIGVLDEIKCNEMRYDEVRLRHALPKDKRREEKKGMERRRKEFGRESV